MSKTMIPQNYTPALNLYDTQRAIGTVKRLFADTLCATLNLYRVSAPLFLEASTGLNDDLNGVERKVTFDIRDTRPRIASISRRPALNSALLLSNQRGSSNPQMFPVQPPASQMTMIPPNSYNTDTAPD